MKLHRVSRALAVFLVLSMLAVPAMAGWSISGIEFAKSLGRAIHTPNVATTLASTPDEGIAIPAGTKSIIITVKTNPIHFYLDDTPTATKGHVLNVGTYEVPNDPRIIAAFTFIDTSAGASTVEVTFLRGSL